MKKLILSTLTLLFCVIVNAQDSTEFAEEVIEAIKSKKVENLQALVAPPSVYREAFPKETFGASNEEIEAETSKSEKLKADFENIQKSAKEKKVDLSKLEFKSIVASPMMPNVYGATITFSVGDKTGKLAVSALKHKGNWYLMEILISVGVFKGF